MRLTSKSAPECSVLDTLNFLNYNIGYVLLPYDLINKNLWSIDWLIDSGEAKHCNSHAMQIWNCLSKLGQL